MKRASRFSSALVVFGLFSACGDSGGATGDTMTVNEISEVTGTLVEPLFFAVFGGTTSPPRAAAAVPVQEVSECDEGGSLSITGDVSDNEDGGGSADLTETVSGCMIMIDDVTFTLAGDPNITLSGSGNDDSASLSFGGGFTYTTDDGRTGGCGISVDASISGVTASFTGSVCGVDISEISDDIVIDF